jgi:predicted nucleic acid-binding protein
MNYVLIDTSVWVEYFRGSNKIKASAIDDLIDLNRICTNDLILSELIPQLKIKKEFDLIDTLQAITNIKLDINWQELIEFQVNNLKNGVNKVGIPDLIILQNAINNDLELYTLDRRFFIMNKHLKFRLFRL